MTFRIQIQSVLVGCIVLCICGIAIASQQQAPGKATLTGIVNSIRTGEPIAGAQVTLSDVNASPTQTPVPISAATTNSRGEFALDNVDPGIYKIVVMNAGYVRRDSARMELAAGQAVKDIVVSMAPTSTVSGRVSNLSGQPLAGISISLQRKVYSANGTIGFSTVFRARTNDLGEYRMYWVTPGRYYVAAEGSDGGVLRSDDRYVYDDAVRRGLNELAEAYAPIYFQGEPDVSRATLIDLKEGADLRGIDFNLVRQSQQRHSIRGRVIDSLTGKVPQLATLILSGFGGSKFSSADSAGAFEFRDLAPGRYALVARADSVRVGPIAAAGPPSSVPWTSATVTIENSNPADLTLMLASHPAISGQLKVEGQLPAGTGMERLRIGLGAESSFTGLSGLGNPSATPGPDATFTLTTVPDGTFRVGISGLPPGFYLKDARLDGADVLNAFSRFATPGNLEVVISASAGIVEGRVVDSQMRPVANTEAVLVPASPTVRSDLFKKAVTDKDGKFIIASIVPGDYKLFAWERLEANSWFDAEVLSRFELKGTRVHITESSRQTVEVTLIPEEVSP